MEWRGRRESSNIQDRRGGGMGRPAGIGGIGLIIVLLVGIFFGVDLTPLLGPGGVATTESAPSGPNVVDDEQERFVAVVLAQTEDVWAPRFEAAGLQYSEPKLVLFNGQMPSACGFAQSAMGPFYCPNDQTVYLDMDFFRVMESQLGSRGEFAKAYVIAHEVGHHVQDEQGILRRSTRRGSGRRAAVERAVGQGRAAGGLLRRGWAHDSQAAFKLTDATSGARSTPRRGSATTPCSARARGGWCPTASRTGRASSGRPGSTAASRRRRRAVRHLLGGHLSGEGRQPAHGQEAAAPRRRPPRDREGRRRLGRGGAAAGGGGAGAPAADGHLRDDPEG